MLRGLLVLAPALVAGISFASTRYASAEDIKLPPTLTFTAYDTGTAGFNIAVGVGKMMKDKYSTDVRVLPAGNDVARLAPLRAKRAAAAAMGSGTYFAQEGVFEFGSKEWGPQSLQILLSSVDCNCGSLGVAADTGVKDLKDLVRNFLVHLHSRRHADGVRAEAERSRHGHCRVHTEFAHVVAARPVGLSFKIRRHCEERSDEAISSDRVLLATRFASPRSQ